jgi:hypothetical protein
MKIFINNIYIYNNYGNIINIQDQPISSHCDIVQNVENSDNSPQVVLSEDNSLIAYLEEQIVKSRQEVRELKERLPNVD